jgi:hypothetical protein
MFILISKDYNSSVGGATLDASLENMKLFGIVIACG